MKKLLIKKGTDLFYKDGFTRSSIRDIGNSAKISSATLYHYFKNKDELLYEIIIMIGNELIKVLNQAIERFADPEERLKQMIYAQICLLKKKKKEVKVYVEEQYKLPPRLKAEIYEQQKRIYDIYLHQLQPFKKAGTLRIDHLPTINFVIFGAINWVYRWFKENESMSLEEIADMIITILFNGIFLPQRSIKGRSPEKKR